MFKETGAYFVVKKIRLIHSFHGLDQVRIRAIKKEIDMNKSLKHENIVEYYGCEVIENNTMCIYLEYMPGGSIADGYKRFKSNYDEKICRLYTLQILDALRYLHQRDIVHGDLKGANALLSKDGEKVKLCDLGSSRQLEASFSSVNTVVNGTLSWMAPEAQFSKIGCKSDIWSLGCLLVEMLTGANPWGARFEDGNQAFMLQRAL
jgi:serine/threonine protein kinase